MSLLPSYITRIFSKASFNTLQKHMEACYRAASLVEALFAHTSIGAWSDVEKLRAQIVDLEREADDLKRDIRIHLPRGFFLPVARTDLLDLLLRQDKIANKAKDIAGLMLSRRLSFPKAMEDSVRSFVQESIGACEMAWRSIRVFDELVKGFRSIEVDRVETLIRDIDLIEHASDDEQVRVRAELYALEPTLSPVDVMFLYRVLDWIGDLADHAEQVGQRLEIMLAK